MKINCLGDSITEGWGLPCPDMQSFPALLQEQFPEHLFVNYGSAGAMVQPFFGSGYADTLAFQVSQQRPADLSLCLLGSNDSFDWTPEFRQEYERLLSSISGPVILVTPPKMAFANKKLEAVRADILALAARLGMPVIDLYAASDPSWLSGDGVHPSASGQQKIARFLAGALKPYLS